MFELWSLEFWIAYIGGWSAIFLIIGIYLYFWLKRPIAHILIRQGKLLFEKGLKRLKRSWEKFDFEDKTYLIDWKYVAWVDSHKREHLLYMEGEAKPLYLGNPEGLKVSRTADKLNLIAAKNTIAQLVRGSLAQAFSGWIPLILGICAGVGIGMILGIFLYPHLIPPAQAIPVANQTVPTIPSP